MSAANQSQHGPSRRRLRAWPPILFATLPTFAVFAALLLPQGVGPVTTFRCLTQGCGLETALVAVALWAAIGTLAGCLLSVVLDLRVLAMLSSRQTWVWAVALAAALALLATLFVETALSGPTLLVIWAALCTSLCWAAVRLAAGGRHPSQARA